MERNGIGTYYSSGSKADEKAAAIPLTRTNAASGGRDGRQGLSKRIAIN